ncbi:MAG: HIRAN domain-containing protein [Lachnospiraceae bacterium]|nr:HIRAN domain-containing protein [Lachnospiraceae bacterium]
MSEIYFTITGMNHYHGNEFMEPKMEVKLTKEPDNEADAEAIKVEMPGIGQIGYVANSPYTVIGESMSAGRIYDKIGESAKGTVLYVLPRGVLCQLQERGPAEDEIVGGMVD